ncbi:MFS transporter [Niallia sp. MER TA 168]|uniref:MFS transporter n=1 Tax=Niallia sp. MER TA 168 TaxID=2939568 RepID=UPI0020408D84|nr:MFS transporter [Niallia sp. MER TA 168]MCM3364571.1 MFS transporter [Niallia sp. MER TA 168]
MMESEQTNSENERLSIKNGVYTTIILNISNNYFPLFAISVLGATNYQVGLISSLPPFIGMFAMIIGSLIINRLQEKKMFTVYSFLAARLFLVGIALVVFIPDKYQVIVFIVLVGIMNFPFSFANLSWQAFIGDIIQEDRRSDFFSTRNKMMTLIGMISTFFIGIFLQFFDKTDSIPFVGLYLLAFVLGLLEINYLKKHVEPKKKELPKKRTTHFGISVFRNKAFLYFIISALFFNFAWQMCWTLFSIYQIKYAGATGLWISLFAVANSIGQIISFKWWARMADKHSNAKMLILVSLGMAIAPFITIFSTNLVFLVITNIFAGLFVSGTVLMLFNQLLDVTNEDNRSLCISNYNILLAFVAFIAPQFGVFILETTNIYTAMNISGFLRAFSGIFFFFLYIYLKRREGVSFKRKMAKI